MFIRMPKSKHIAKLGAAIAGLAISASSLMAQINVVNTASVVSPTPDDPKTALLSFNAGASANKLIVQVSAEGQNVASITYQGVPLTEAVAGSGRNMGIYYLDNPFTGGAADLSVILGEGVTGGIAVGVVSISGAAPGAAVSAVANGAATVTLTVPVSGSFVVGGYADNGSGTITLPSGHTALYNSNDIGSAHAAASYANAQPSGSRTYAFVDPNLSSPVTSAAVFVPASAAPVITNTNPAAGAASVPVDANLTVTFSEPVVAGSGIIQLWQSGGSSPLESFDVANSSQLTFAGPNLTINPDGNLAPNTFYHVLIGSTAVIDTSGGNPFAGISNPAVWSFSTGSSPPLVPTFSPKDNGFGVALNANLVATFSETVQKGTGNITIHRADGSVRQGHDQSRQRFPSRHRLLRAHRPHRSAQHRRTILRGNFRSHLLEFHRAAGFDHGRWPPRVGAPAEPLQSLARHHGCRGHGVLRPGRHASGHRGGDRKQFHQPIPQPVPGPGQRHHRLRLLLLAAPDLAHLSRSRDERAPHPAVARQHRGHDVEMDPHPQPAHRSTGNRVGLSYQRKP
ncbi:MAG: Ig-like domain-containing protein [Akkermansiaceae bacterium]|nr:Ig-like domain-containing protein [Akkermansiaceae bacterium]